MQISGFVIQEFPLLMYFVMDEYTDQIVNHLIAHTNLHYFSIV